MVTQAAEVRTHIGLTGQYAALDDYLTGRANLIMIGQLARLGRAQARQRAAELLERFDLTGAAGRAVKTYSGGMRRRLDLAASLIGRPEVLFLDEPTTGLDPRSRSVMWEIIRELAGAGTTLLLTTQYLDEADQLADQIAVIDAGQVIAAGTPDALKARIGDDRLTLVLAPGADLAAAAAAVTGYAAGPVSTVAAGPGGRRPADHRPGHRPGRDHHRGGPVPGRGRGPGHQRDPAPSLTGRRVPHPHRQRGRRRAACRGFRSGRTHRRCRMTASTMPMTMRWRGPRRPTRTPRRSALRWWLSDVLVLTQRSLARIVREPETLMDVTIQPIVFVLLFAYVFGSAIAIPGGGSYNEYLIGGMLGMGLAGTAPGTAVALVTDMSTGLIDRFRSLPMSRAAVLAGRTLADLLTQALGALVVAGVGLAIGWRIHTGVADTLAAFGLALLLGYAFTWAGACLGMVLRSPEAAQQLGFILFLPLTFISNAFVPTQGMPGWLQVGGELEPAQRAGRRVPSSVR